MAKFTKEQLMKLAEIHLIEVDGIAIDVHIHHNWAHLWAHDAITREIMTHEHFIYPTENVEQRIQNFLEKVKQVNHD